MTDGLIWRRVSEIKPEPMELEEATIRRMPGYPDIVRAISNSEFRDSHHHSRINIASRYLRSGWPAWFSVLGILNGYSSPSEWRHAHRIHRRLGIRKADFAPVQH